MPIVVNRHSVLEAITLVLETKKQFSHWGGEGKGLPYTSYIETFWSENKNGHGFRELSEHNVVL